MPSWTTVYLPYARLVIPRLTLLSVIIPSRTQPDQASFLTRALKSISEQTARASLTIEVVIGLDPGAIPPQISSEQALRYAHATERSQAAALNAAAALATGDYVAFLEDDDQWHASHLATALEFLKEAQFVSTTQLEADAAGLIVRINDFPTPSGWVMPRSTWDRIGPFNASYRYHLDSEWLGRLGDAPLERIHLVEATAPVQLAVAAQVRPWLARVLSYGGAHVRLARHRNALPNVLRLVHGQSGMGQIASDAAKRAASEHEVQRLLSQFGRVPW